MYRPCSCGPNGRTPPAQCLKHGYDPALEGMDWSSSMPLPHLPNA